jgi:hypothetical protein
MRDCVILINPHVQVQPHAFFVFEFSACAQADVTPRPPEVVCVTPVTKETLYEDHTRGHTTGNLCCVVTYSKSAPTRGQRGVWRTHRKYTSCVSESSSICWMRLLVDNTLPLQCMIFRSVPQTLPDWFLMLHLNVVVYCPEFGSLLMRSSDTRV